jgi:hypothetical protein
LRPTVATLHRHLPIIDSALETGIPVLKRTPIMNDLTGKVFQALDDLAKQPQTMLALKDLHTTFNVARPLTEFVAPYQTVCNNATAFFTGLSTHISMGVANGTTEEIQVKSASHSPDAQKHNYGSADSQRPADIPSNWDPQKALDREGSHYQIFHGGPYAPAVDAQGNADCQTGQYGYIDGPWNINPKYAPSSLPTTASQSEFNAWENSHGGGSHTSTRNDNPGLAGGTYVARNLRINNLSDVK